MTRARTLAMFGSVRIREFVRGRDDTRSRLDRVAGLVGLHSVRSGGIEIDTASGRLRLGANSAFLLGHDVPLPAAPVEGLRLLSILIPAETLTGAIAPEPGEVRTVSESSALLDPALAFAERAAVLDPDPVSGFGSYYFERLLQEMVIGVAVEGTRAPRMNPKSDAYTRALAMIIAQREDPSLSPKLIAEHLAVSLRQLQRAFRSHGTTPERQIRRARVDHAAALLEDRTYDPLTIAEIGRYAGFSDGSSLARAMSQEGRESPANVRRAALLSASLAASSIPSATYPDRLAT
ncbi:MAG: helix-turn-helix domain-containing protein [Candidatus Microbacterium colombiense]|nr:MAG: helix-turn-helix domain-containing protein [Microbacterium sp.]